MESFKLALVQHNSIVGRKSENLAATVSWVRKARRKGASLVCLPELGVTGHAGHAAMVREAEAVPGGESVDALSELASELDMYICAGIAEDDRGIHYNTQFLVGPEGYVGKQRKVHLSNDEYFYFRGGTDLPVLELAVGRVGMIICYDNSFPEIARCLAVKGAELLLCPHAARFGKWPRNAQRRRRIVADHKDRFAITHSARSLDNGCYVGLCNAAGQAAVGLRGVDANHSGGCMVWDPTGRLAAQSRSRDIRDEMVVADLDGRAVAERRSQRCFNLQTRRPEVFAALCEPTA